MGLCDLEGGPDQCRSAWQDGAFLFVLPIRRLNGTIQAALPLRAAIAVLDCASAAHAARSGETYTAAARIQGASMSDYTEETPVLRSLIE